MRDPDPVEPVPGQTEAFDIPVSPGFARPAPTRAISPIFDRQVVRTVNGRYRHLFWHHGTTFTTSLCGDASWGSRPIIPTIGTEDCHDCLVAAWSSIALELREFDTMTSRRLAAAVAQAAVRAGKGERPSTDTDTDDELTPI